MTFFDANDTRIASSNTRVSNPRVAGSSPAAPTTSIFPADNKGLIPVEKLQLSEFPYIDLVCQYKGDPYHIRIDTHNLPKVLGVSMRWKVANFYPRGYRLYAYCSKYARGINTMVYLHRVVTGAPQGLEADHLNHNGLDNRERNLRVVTHKHNMNNRIDHQMRRGTE